MTSAGLDASLDPAKAARVTLFYHHSEPRALQHELLRLPGLWGHRGITITVTKITDVPTPFATMPTYDDWGPGDLEEDAIRQQWDVMRGDLARYRINKVNISAPNQLTRTTTGLSTTRKHDHKIYDNGVFDYRAYKYDHYKHHTISPLLYT